VATEPIVTIEIDDTEFREFVTLFERYREMLDSSRSTWYTVAKEVNAVKVDSQRAADELRREGTFAYRVVEAHKKFGMILDGIAVSWSRASSSAKTWAVDVARSTISLQKWTALTAVFSGLVGAGGLWGINRMAAGVASRRSGAMGLGTSYGQYSSFMTNFERLGNAPGIIGGFSDALGDIRRRGPLYSLFDAGRIKSLEKLGPAEAFAEALPRIKELIDQTDPRQRGAMLRARGLDQLGIDLETANVIAGMSPAELRQLVENYRRDVDPLGLPAKAAKEWTDFTTRVTAAGVTLQNVIAVNLVGLTEPFMRLSKTLVDLFERLIRPGGLLEKGVAAAGRGIDWLAGQLGGPDFLAGAESFVQNLQKLVELFDKITWSTSDPDSGAFGQAPSGPGAAKRNRYFNYFFGRTSGGGSGGAGGGSSGGGGASSYSEPWVAGGSNRFTVEGNARVQGAQNVDPRLLKVLDEASADLPPGWKAVAFSGYRPGDPRYHGRGMATDVALYDAEGRRLANYQDPRTFRAYERFAQSAKKIQSEKYPDMPFRWGGYFSGGPGRYGALDTMHFDTGNTSMGGGSWEGGLSQAQRAIWGADSRGMGNISDWQRPKPADVRKEDLPMPAPMQERTLGNYMGLRARATNPPTYSNPQTQGQSAVIKILDKTGGSASVRAPTLLSVRSASGRPPIFQGAQ
jgi:hypothetical protein